MLDYKYQDGKVYVENFPIIQQSDIQKDFHFILDHCQMVMLFVSRRLGKTTECANKFYDFLIKKGDLMKFGQMYVATHPKAQELYNKFYNNWFKLPFGGPENFKYSLDDVYIKLPERYYNYLFPDGSINPELAQNKDELLWWFGDPKKQETPLLEEFEKTWYVKLFKENMGAAKSSRRDERVWKSKLFNGAEIHLISANHNFDDYTSGSSFYGIWGEEVGNWSQNFLSIVSPAILAKNGFIMLSGTPPKTPNPQDHWSYKEYIEPLEEGVKNGQYQLSNIHGVNYYISKNTTTVMDIDKHGKPITTKITTSNAIVIGKLEECFLYTHSGAKGFAYVLGQLQEELEVEYLKDTQGNFILDPWGKPKYKIIRTGKSRPGMIIDRDTYRREYMMDFSPPNTVMVFDNFGEHNILPVETVPTWEKCPTLNGFDKGMGQVNVATQQILASPKESITLEMKVAVLPNNQFVIYDEYLLNYDYNEVANLFFSRAKNGQPTIFDSVMKTRQGTLDDKHNHDIHQLTLKEKRLSASYRSGFYARCLIPCLKRSLIVKVKEYNNMFLTQPGIFTHPLSADLPGAQLYITENCKHTINLLKTWAWQTDENLEFKLDKNNERIPQSVRDDTFDGFSYPIDTYLYDANKKSLIETIWKDKRYRDEELLRSRLQSQRFPMTFSQFTAQHRS